MEYNRTLHKRLAILSICIVLLLIVWIGLTITRVLSFHVINTNPNTNTVYTVTPFLVVNFSKDISSSTVSMTSSPSVFTSFSVSGKQLRVSLSEPMTAGQEYTITIHNVSDTAGKQLRNLRFTFTPQYLTDSSKLPADQQKVLLQQQTKSAAKAPITFTHTDALTNNGLSSTQVQVIEQDVEDFTKANKTTLSTAAVDSNSVTPGPLDGSGNFSLTFTITIDGQKYGAKVLYSNITNVELQLTNPSTSVQVYDSSSGS